MAAVEAAVEAAAEAEPLAPAALGLELGAAVLRRLQRGWTGLVSRWRGAGRATATSYASCRCCCCCCCCCCSTAAALLSRGRWRLGETRLHLLEASLQDVLSILLLALLAMQRAQLRLEPVVETLLLHVECVCSRKHRSLRCQLLLRGLTMRLIEQTGNMVAQPFELLIRHRPSALRFQLTQLPLSCKQLSLLLNDSFFCSIALLGERTAQAVAPCLSALERSLAETHTLRERHDEAVPRRAYLRAVRCRTGAAPGGRPDASDRFLPRCVLSTTSSPRSTLAQPC